MSDCGCIIQGECLPCQVERLTKERDEALGWRDAYQIGRASCRERV